MPVEPFISQNFINIGLMFISTVFGWVFKFLYDKLRELQTADLQLAEKVQSIELLVAGTYIKRTEMEKMYDALFSKLDRIENKLDGKADKQR